MKGLIAAARVEIGLTGDEAFHLQQAWKQVDAMKGKIIWHQLDALHRVYYWSTPRTARDQRDLGIWVPISQRGKCLGGPRQKM